MRLVVLLPPKEPGSHARDYVITSELVTSVTPITPPSNPATNLPGSGIAAAPATIRPGSPDFSAAVARPLGLLLHAFSGAGQMLEVRVPWLSATLWWVPDGAAAETLVAEGVSRGRVWTAGELADVLSVPGITGESARMVALAKLGIDGEVTAVRPRAHGEGGCAS
jgi:hypothetical protein